MHELDPDINLEFFVGKTLVQVCVGTNEIILNFEPSLRITALSKISCARSAMAFQIFADHREAAKILVHFLDDVVVSAKAEAGGTIVVLFQSGGRIKLTDDSKQYESYLIDNGGDLLVV